MAKIEVCSASSRCECISVPKIFDQCRLQVCLTPGIIGPATRDNSSDACSRCGCTNEKILPPSAAASVTTDNFCIKNISIINKAKSAFRPGSYDITVKFTFSYCLIFFNNDSDEITKVPACSSYTTTVTLFGGDDVCVAVLNELYGKCLQNGPFVSIEASAMPLATELRYPVLAANTGCCCCGCCCGCNCCGCGCGNGTNGCGCGSGTNGCGCGSGTNGCGCGSGTNGCGCGSGTNGCGCGSVSACGTNPCDSGTNACGSGTNACGSATKGCGCGNGTNGCGCGNNGCGCGNNGCGCGNVAGTSCGRLSPIAVDVTIGLFAVVKLLRLSNLSVHSYGNCTPCECENVSPDVDNPCEFFENLQFPTNLFAPQTCYQPCSCAGTTNVPAGTGKCCDKNC